MTKEPVMITTEQEQGEPAPVVHKKRRAHKSGSVAAKNVRKQSKSSAPIFFEKTMSHMNKEHAPPKTRSSPGARGLMRTVIEHKIVNLARRAYAITKSRNRKSSNVRAVGRDVELVLSLF